MLDVPWDTRLQSYAPFSQPPFQTNRVRQQTYGVTATLQATRSWQHTLTLGYDQTYFDYYQTRPRFISPDDSLLFVATIQEAKVSLLYHTDVRIPLSGKVAGIVTAGVNYDSYDYVSIYTAGTAHRTGSLDGMTGVDRDPSSSTGYFGQGQLSLAERLFLTGGLRAERNPNFGTSFGTAWSPRVGAAYAQPIGEATLKLRASFGESIRAP